jgi:hypothetical protein
MRLEGLKSTLQNPPNPPDGGAGAVQATEAAVGMAALVAWAVGVYRRSPMPREVAGLGRLPSMMPAPVRGWEGYGHEAATCAPIRPQPWELDLAEAVMAAVGRLRALYRALVIGQALRVPVRVIRERLRDPRSDRALRAIRAAAEHEAVRLLGREMGVGDARAVLIAAGADDEVGLRRAWSEWAARKKSLPPLPR